MRTQGQIFVVSAPSGTGKTTIIRALRENVNGLGYSVSHTTRRPRDGEKEGRDYFFVSREGFRNMIKKGAFVEWAEVYGDFYGTAISNLREQTATGDDVLLDLDVQGARSIKMHFQNAVLIYVLPPSFEVLRRRLENRGKDSERDINTRLEAASSEIKNCKWYDYIVINDDLKEAIREMQSIFLSRSCSAGRRMDRVKELFPAIFH